MTTGDPNTLHAARQAILNDAALRYEVRFGSPPTWLAAAPGRVNLIGEHTDYNDGFVLPIAIDRWAVVAAGPTQGNATTIVAADLEDLVQFSGAVPAEPVSNHAWANYVCGVMNEFQLLGASTPPLDVLITSTVPIGAGLSSSAAVEVATATMLEDATGLELGAVEKAKLCQRAEHTFAGTPCGIMDMLISCCGVADHALLIDCRDCTFGPLPMPGRAAVLVVDTGVQHDLATSEYAERRASCVSAADKLGVASLRDATLAMLQQDDLTEIECKRASHVITENTRTLLGAHALQEGECETLGELMFASHESLRELYAVSCPELDVIVNVARILHGENGGVFGARMTGGGFGGSAIVLCEADAAADVAAMVQKAFQESFGREPPVERVRASGGAVLSSPTDLGRC